MQEDFSFETFCENSRVNSSHSSSYILAFFYSLNTNVTTVWVGIRKLDLGDAEPKLSKMVALQGPQNNKMVALQRRNFIQKKPLSRDFRGCYKEIAIIHHI